MNNVSPLRGNGRWPVVTILLTDVDVVETRRIGQCYRFAHQRHAFEFRPDKLDWWPVHERQHQLSVGFPRVKKARAEQKRVHHRRQHAVFERQRQRFRSRRSMRSYKMADVAKTMRSFGIDVMVRVTIINVLLELFLSTIALFSRYTFKAFAHSQL